MLIELHQVGLTLQNKVILENINLSVHQGEIITIVGPNGAGKSMLIKILLKLLHPSFGKVRMRKNLRIGYMPQNLNLESLMPLTVERFLMLSPHANKYKCLNLAEDLHIKHLLYTSISAVSGGELQLILLARALLNDPKLLVLDEPAQGVDINGQSAIYEYILKMQNKLQCSIIMVSHDLHLVIASTKKVICLNRHICCYGDPESITQHPEFIKIFGQKVSNNLAIYKHSHC